MRRHEVPVRVAEERHPQLVVGKLRDEVRLVDERRAARRKLLVGRLQVGHAEVDRGARVVELVQLRRREHDPHVAAHEERERAGLEEVLEPEHVAIERDGSRQVAGPDRNLADVLDRCRHVVLLLGVASVRGRRVC